MVLVDDGLATGASMRAAVGAVRSQAPAAVVVAVPVGATATCELLRAEADAGRLPAHSPARSWPWAVWYDDFSPTTDEEVRRLLTVG